MFWVVAITTLVLDQVTKAVVRQTLVPEDVAAFIPGFMRFTHVRNPGAAFGLFPGGRTVFVIAAAAMVIIIITYVMRTRPESLWVLLGFGLVAGGATGNLIDRALTGYVTDFFETLFVEFPVFNIADCGVSVGTVLIAAWLLFAPENGTSPDEEPEGVQE